MGSNISKDEVAYKIEGVNKDILKQLKSEISLEDFLKEKIKAIPSYINEFKLETKIIKFKDKFVVLIEVLNTNWERIFYSDITQYVYVRIGKSTKQMYLQDTLRIIAERSYPQVYMNIKQSKSAKLRDKVYCRYEINIINKGIKTAEKIHSFILIGSEEELDITPSDGFSASIESLDLTNHLINFIQKYDHIKTVQFTFPKINKGLLNIDRIYPFFITCL